jgi:rubrerythrin
MNEGGMVALLKDALQLEIEGWLFYHSVAYTLPKGAVRDVFVYLAEQEEKHRQYIHKELKQVQADSMPDISGLGALKETTHDEVLADAVRSATDLS